MPERRTSNFWLKIKDLGVLMIVGAILFATLAPRWGVAFAGLVFFVVFMIWVMFFMPTKCDFALQSRLGGCEVNVRGKLRGCRKYNHERRKRDAVWAALRMRNPGLIFRVMWLGQSGQPMPLGGNTGRSGSGGGPDTGNPSRQTASEITMLVATVVGSVAAVIALFFH